MATNHRVILAALGVALAAVSANAEKSYGPGVSDTEIRIGNTAPYSGPASAYGAIGKAQAAYFRMINDAGGVNGRKIRFITLDDGYSPPKTVEMVRRLIEQDQVLFLVGTLGTAPNSAVHRYVNQMKVPHLFVSSGASKWNDPAGHPWTMGFNPSYRFEARLYAKEILRARPDAKIGILYQNDDMGKDYLAGFMEGLGSGASVTVVKTASYEVTDATVDSQLVALQSSGANVFFNVTTPKFAAQAIRRVADIGWRPEHYIVSVAANIGSVLKPAGLDRSVGLISSAYTKDPANPKWAADPAVVEYLAIMKKYAPEVDPLEGAGAYGVAVAQLTVQLLKQCGDNLTRENVMKQAASIKDFQVPLLLPGVLVSTAPADFAPVKALQLVKFDGTSWVPYGDPIAAR